MASVALLTVTGILSQAVGFAYRVGLTRLAGAEIMGLYQLILPVYSILLSLTSVGLTTASPISPPGTRPWATGGPSGRCGGRPSGCFSS